jgi:hypothetical protein
VISRKSRLLPYFCSVVHERTSSTLAITIDSVPVGSLLKYLPTAPGSCSNYDNPHNYMYALSMLIHVGHTHLPVDFYAITYPAPLPKITQTKSSYLYSLCPSYRASFFGPSPISFWPSCSFRRSLSASFPLKPFPFHSAPVPAS